jgi:hypothetical protein
LINIGKINLATIKSSLQIPNAKNETLRSTDSPS